MTRLLLSTTLAALVIAAMTGQARAENIPANDLPLRIGADSQGGSRFAGEVACARLYARALSPGEIRRRAATRPGEAVRASGLVGQWVFDSPIGGAFPNRVANGLDARPVGPVGTAEVEGIRAARLGEGYLQVDADPRLNVRRAMTLEAWVRPGALPGSGGRIMDRITPGGSDGWLLDTYPGASLRLIVGPDTLHADNVLSPGVWTHVAATVAPDGTRALYLNGRQIAGGRGGEEGITIRGNAPAPRNPLALWYRQPAARWTEALALGNGRIGGMLYGGVRRERVLLNEDTLWSGEPGDTMPKEAASALPEVRRLLLEGKNRAAHDLVAARMLGPYFQSYLPLGEISLDFGDIRQAQDYRRELDLATAMARVRYRIGDATFTREAFISYPAQALVMRLACDKPGRLRFAVSLSTPLHGTTRAGGEEVILTGRAPAFYDAYTGRPAVYEDGPDGRGMRFEARACIRAEGGTVTAEGDRLRVEGADAVTLVLAARTSYNGFDRSPGREGKDPTAACQRDLSALEGRDFDALRAAHLTDYRALFDRVTLELRGGDGGVASRQSPFASPKAHNSTLTTHDSPSPRLPTDERVRAYEPGNDPGLAALYFQFGRYLLISGSRPGTQPLNLQGIWCYQLPPPWASNWTLNCNAEINHWPVEVANLSECHLPLIEMTRELSVDGARVAREIYGARGWMAHHNADLWKRATPVSGDPVWAIFQVGGAWLCRHAWEHYAFSGDTDYLRRVWPTLREAARYFLDRMMPEPKHGWLVDWPATNFESYFRKPDGETAAVCMGPTADMQMIRQLFQDCVQASRLLDTDADFRAELEQALPRLAPMQVSPRTGQLQEWLEDWDHATPGNGQMLSLWGLICAPQITPRGTPDLSQAVRKALEDRKPWNLWTGSWTGAFAACAFARLGDGDMAAMVLDKHLGRVVNPNLTANFEGMAEWEIDGNMGQTAAIAEMLLQSHTGDIELLPALPSEWPQGRVTGLRARGGFEVAMEWKAGRLTGAEIRSLRGGPCRVRLGEKTVDLEMRPGERCRLDGNLNRLRAVRKAAPQK